MDGLMSGFIPYEIKTSLVKITSYADRELQGTLINPYFAREMRFSNALQFLALVEELLDAIGCPHKAMETPGFKSARCEPMIGDADERPALATFKLNVLFRQNASWQGRLVWLDKKSETQFRSALELLMILDNVLL